MGAKFEWDRIANSANYVLEHLPPDQRILFDINKQATVKKPLDEIGPRYGLLAMRVYETAYF